MREDSRGAWSRNVVKPRTAVRIAALGLMLVSGIVLGQSGGWPMWYPHGTKVRTDALAVYAADAADGYFTPQDILRYPRLGVQKTWWEDGRFLFGDNDSTSVLYLGAGNNGVIRSMWMCGLPNITNYTDLNNYELRIYVGAGDVADKTAPSSDYLTAQIGIGPLLGRVYDNVASNYVVETPIVDHLTVAGPKNMALTFNAPIPFTNGVLVQLWDRVADTLSACTWHWATYELGETNFPYKAWTLRAQTRRHTIVNSAEYDTFLTVPSGAGMLLGVFASFESQVDTVSMAFLEGNWCFQPDAATSEVWQTSGGEDLFGMEPLYFDSGVHRNYNWGCTNITETQAEAYRIFVRDPLIWDDGIIGKFQNAFYGSGDLGATSNVVEVSILTLYYGSE